MILLIIYLCINVCVCRWVLLLLIHKLKGITNQPMQNYLQMKKYKQTPTGEGSRKRTRSDVWEHLSRLPNNYDRCKCRYCSRDMSCPTKSGTTNLRKHLTNCRSFIAWKSANKSKTQSHLATDEEGNMSVGKVGDRVFKDATNEMIALAELPFNFVESLAWKHFCNKVQLPPPVCRKTCTKEIAAMYKKRKEEMKKFLEHNNQDSLSQQIYGLLLTLALVTW